ncbi:serine/threonine-protein kinase ULK1 [Protopterus annectens]|uniref:serine/threonine-protein kinase ULK1 n=1 Tax=Protopterus annectens TaxID=7888 RepID=UPI001CF9386E|nr:serine/threonine-protein kinase ULK1 [Protopterus annectens]
METVGKFEFSRKDLIGHGAFAVVFKGRHKEQHDLEAAIKCINKKNLAKSQTLLGKEIKILKELKHENIVALYDFQEMANSVYLVMEYCNGGDLADYLHSKGTLSEDTIRLFLQQIAGAMKMLHSKGVIHRDLKPQNILLSYVGSKKSNPSNIRIKIADFGFARYLQSNTMAATLCGSPMYMAPEVIMSQHYDAKADLWSIGTIIYQCLTGKAPFQASSPQDLRMFYEKNKTLTPNIPRETSSLLRELLQGLLQRNYKDRMEFDDFFHHAFLEVGSSMKKSAPVPLPSYPSSGSGSSCSSSSTSHLASPPSLAEIQHLHEKTLMSPTQGSPGFLHGSKESVGSSSKNSSCDTDDFVMVPAQLSSDIMGEAAGGKPAPGSLVCCGSSLVTSAGLGSQGRASSPSLSYSSSPSPSSRGTHLSSSSCGQSLPIPVPSQIHNYQRIEQNLQSPTRCTSPRSGGVRRSSSTSPLGFGKSGASPPYPGETGAFPAPRRLSFGGSKPFLPSFQVGTIPEQPGQDFSTSPFGVDARGRTLVSGVAVSEQSPRGLGSRLHSAPNLPESYQCRQKIKKQHSDPVVTTYSHAQGIQTVHSLHPPRQMRSSPKLSDFLQRSPLPTIVGSPTKAAPAFNFPRVSSPHNLVNLWNQPALVTTPTRNRTLPDLKEMGQFQYQQPGLAMRPAEDKSPIGRSFSTGKLTDLLLKAAFGVPVSEASTNDSFSTEKPMDTAPSAVHGSPVVAGYSTHAPVMFTVGSPPSGTTPPQTTRTRLCSVGSSSSHSSGGSFSSRPVLQGLAADALEGPCSLRYTFSDPVAITLEGAVAFEAPELPEETLMEQEHTDILRILRFNLMFAQCVMEIAAAKESGCDIRSSLTSVCQLQESMVADQISLLSKEWSYAEQLVLYMKVAELLSTILRMAIEQIKAGKLCLSSAVKQVVKKMNELYKSSVTSCQSLNHRLQRFFLDKQKLMDRIDSITAEKLIYTHAVQMVQSAALDEMFRQGEGCIQRYQKALLLMEGLLHIITDQGDMENITKCKVCIERRLSTLQLEMCG